MHQAIASRTESWYRNESNGAEPKRIYSTNFKSRFEKRKKVKPQSINWANHKLIPIGHKLDIDQVFWANTLVWQQKKFKRMHPSSINHQQLVTSIEKEWVLTSHIVFQQSSSGRSVPVERGPHWVTWWRIGINIAFELCGTCFSARTICYFSMADVRWSSPGRGVILQLS